MDGEEETSKQRIRKRGSNINTPKTSASTEETWYNISRRRAESVIDRQERRLDQLNTHLDRIFISSVIIFAFYSFLFTFQYPDFGMDSTMESVNALAIVVLLPLTLVGFTYLLYANPRSIRLLTPITDRLLSEESRLTVLPLSEDLIDKSVQMSEGEKAHIQELAEQIEINQYEIKEKRRSIIQGYILISLPLLIPALLLFVFYWIMTIGL